MSYKYQRGRAQVASELYLVHTVIQQAVVYLGWGK